MTHRRTRTRTAAGLSGVLLAAASTGIAAADAYYRPARHHGNSVVATTEPADTTPTSAAAGDGKGEIEPTVTCGTERWDVKTGTDSAATGVDQSAVDDTTVANLNGIVAPKSPKTRVAPVEDTVYEVTATLTDFKVEPDSDYHLALADDNGQKMIAEIPAPACVRSGPFRAAIAQARAAFDARFRATTKYKQPNVSVTIRGVGFFDRIHNQRGVAKNGIELHPVLAIVFNP